MNSNSNLPSPAAEPSRFFTVRLARFLGRRIRGVGRFVFSRRMVWTLAILGSLLVLLYQYENWNGARELAEARKKMIARIGTDNYLDLLPEEVPEAENFYAIDEIKSWRVPDTMGAGGFKTVFPTDRLLPVGVVLPQVIEEPGNRHLEMDGWLKRRIGEGKALPESKTAAQILHEEMGNGDAIISGLVNGLKKSGSQLIPSRRTAMETAGGNPAAAKLPYLSGVYSFQNALSMHLMAASQAGDAVRTCDIAGIMLRLANGVGQDYTLVSELARLAQNRVTLPSMNPALQCPSLADSHFVRLQEWLSENDDLEQTEKVLISQAVSNYTFYNFIKLRISDGKKVNGERGDLPGGVLGLLIRLMPLNWLDANSAFALERHLEFCRDTGGEAWRSRNEAGKEVSKHMEKSSVLVSVGPVKIPNPRRLLAAIGVPALNGVWRSAAENLFNRRCAILTCALHRHRLAHGVFPDDLAGLDAAFLPEPMKDPAKAGALLNYRTTGQGFLLWSVGDDRNDDGGDADKDWIWRHEPAAG